MRAVARALAAASMLICIVATGPARADDTPAAPVEGAELREARVEIDGMLGQMRATSTRVRDQLRVTRKRGTPAQITCVDQALSRSDVALRRARATSDEVLAAYARGDAEGARAARRRLVEIRWSQVVAANEGSACTPAPVQIVSAGTTTVRLQIDPKIAPAPL